MAHSWLQILQNGNDFYHVVEQWAQPLSKYEFWSGTMPPIGASLGLKNTRIWYKFKFLQNTLETNASIRLVCQHCTETPQSQIHVSVDYETFLNVVITVQSVEGDMVTGVDHMDKKYIWDQKTKILVLCEKYPFLKNCNINVCEPAFTMRVNEDYYIDKTMTAEMEKKQEEKEKQEEELYCTETLENVIVSSPDVTREPEEDFMFTLDDDDDISEFYL